MHWERPPGNSGNRPLFLTNTFWKPGGMCSLVFKKRHGFCRGRMCTARAKAKGHASAFHFRSQSDAHYYEHYYAIAPPPPRSLAPQRGAHRAPPGARGPPYARIRCFTNVCHPVDPVTPPIWPRIKGIVCCSL